MIKKLKGIFTSKSTKAPMSDFSRIFQTASPEEKKKLFSDIAREVNAEQRALVEAYKKTLPAS